MELYLLGEHLLVAVVVGQAGQHAAVVHRPRPQTAVLAVVGRHVTGDSGAAAIAGEDDLVALGGGPARSPDRPFDRRIQSDVLAMDIRRDSGPHHRCQYVDVALDQPWARSLLPH